MNDIHLPGCGGMYPYVYGLCGALQNNTDVRKFKFSTISGSTPGVSTILFNAPAKGSLASFETKKQKLLEKSGFMIYFNGEFIRMAKEHNIRLAEKYATEEDKVHAMENHKIMVVCANSFRREEKTNFKNFEEYVELCSASCSFVVLPENGPFIDGCMICASPSISYFGKRLPIPLRYMCWFKKFYYIIMGLLTTQVWRTLYDQGYKDAEEILIPKLSE